jgi:hypothetical protein
MLDPVQGKDVDNIINDLLTESAYGKIIENQWIWNGKKPSMHENCKEDSSQVSYGTFLRIKVSFINYFKRDFSSLKHPLSIHKMIQIVQKHTQINSYVKFYVAILLQKAIQVNSLRQNSKKLHKSSCFP